MREEDEVLTQILQAADKHPNSRVSKLIRGVVDEPTQKNIVLLLIELSDHSEYSTDFGISLKYYLNLFERLGIGRDIVLNEAGLLLLNSSKIYARRVDYVQELVERQICTLSSAELENQTPKDGTQQSASIAEKPKRGRKRLVEAPNDPYEVELVPKKFRKLSAEKRFAVDINKLKPKKPTSQRHQEIDQYVHPAGWLHSHIVDFDNEEEIDSKRNYKLFTYHVEHRYNTLVPDINFRLHFKVKDYIDEEEERMHDEDSESVDNNALHRVWPPLSEAYVEKYLHLENHILAQERQPQPRRTNFEALNESVPLEHISTLDEHFCDAEEDVREDGENHEKQISDNSAPENVVKNSSEQISEHPALEQVQNLNISVDTECNKDATLNVTLLNTSENNTTQNDSGLGNSLLDSSKSNDDSLNATSSVCEAHKSISNDNMTGINKNLESFAESSTESAPLDQVQNLNTTAEHPTILDDTNNEINTNKNDQSIQNDSALGNSIASAEESVNSTASASILEQSLNATLAENDKSLNPSENVDESLVENSLSISLNKAQRMDFGFESCSDAEQSPTEDKKIDLPLSNKNSDAKDDTQINIGEIRVLLPHLDDEGVFFSDLDEQELRLLSPAVVATDVFPSIPNKKNITIIVDNDIRAMLSIEDDEPETFVMPLEKQPVETPIVYNIFKFHEKFLKRRVLFKLGPEMDLYLQARSLKRTRNVDLREHRQPKMMKWFALNNTDMTGIVVTPPPSPGRNSEDDFCGFSVADDEYSQDFLGFEESDFHQKIPDDQENEEDHISYRLSRDSGVGVDATVFSSKSDLFTEEDSGVESAENSESLEDCVQSLFDNVNPNNDVDKTNDEKVCSQIMEFLDSILKEVAETTADLNCATDAIATGTNSAQSDQSIENAKESSTENTEDIAKDIDQEMSLDANRAETGQENRVDVNTNSNKNSETLLIDDVDEDDDCWNNEDVPLSKSINSGIEQELDKALTNVELNNSKTKIQKWHEHLQPILAKSRQRHHFDVFQIGTEIIEKMQSDVEDDDDNNLESTAQAKCISFQDVMDNKDESYVSRYFLSSLLLANQNNIKFTVNNKSSEAPSAWSDVKFELLSTQRHTVAIEDDIGNTKIQSSAAKKGDKSKNTKTQSNDLPCSSAAIADRNTTSITCNNDRNLTLNSCSTDSLTSTAVPSIHTRLAHNNDIVKVNLNIVKPFKQIEKMPQNSDDYDSGIFSSEELIS